MPDEKAPSSGAFLPASLMYLLSGEPMHYLSGVDSRLGGHIIALGAGPPTIPLEFGERFSTGRSKAFCQEFFSRSPDGSARFHSPPKYEVG